MLREFGHVFRDGLVTGRSFRVTLTLASASQVMQLSNVKISYERDLPQCQL